MDGKDLYNDILSLPDGPYFRLLTLHPSPTKDAPIRCSLTTLPLAGRDAYEALSYCWGDANDTRPVKCNEATLHVTVNLEAALCQLRHATTDRVLWVDAVCIDQSNMAERASQVGHMRTIYRHAARVLVWLGPTDEGSDLVFPLCESIAKNWFTLIHGTGTGDDGDVTSSRVMDEVTQPWARTSLIASQPRLRERWADVGEGQLRSDFDALLGQSEFVVSGGLLTFDYTDDDGTRVTATLARLQFEQFLAFMRLIRRAWWTRSWVVQEICLAREALVLCGDGAIDWSVFSTAIVVVNWESNNPMLSLLSKDYAMSLMKLITRFKLVGKSMDLLDMLWQFRSLQATDPRDKVHAFLGLIPEDDLVHQRVKPDYDNDSTHCYKRAARTCISQRGNLDLFVTERFPMSGLASSLPSWAPDWSFADPNTAPLPLQVPQGSELLSVSGIVVDELAELEVPLPPANDLYGSFFEGKEDEFDFQSFRKTVTNVGTYFDVLMQWEAFATASSKSPADKERLMRELSVTLCAGSTPHGLEETYDSFLSWRANLKWPKRLARLDRRLAKGNILPRSLYYPLVGYWGMDTRLPAELEKGNEVFISRILVAGTRRLGRTASRGRLCLVPRHAQLGDRVVLCQGSKLPLILRGSDNQQSWELVGCAYVHGIMFGEAWKHDDCREFRLC